MTKENKYLLETTLEKYPSQKECLDVENDEKSVRIVLNILETAINSDRSYDEFVTFHLYPNIPIIMAFMEKWKVDPYVGARWIVIDNNDADGLVMDLDSYNDDFSFCRLNNKTFEYYHDAYKETSIDPDNYQYGQHFSQSTVLDEMTTSFTEEGYRDLLRKVPLEYILDELKDRTHKESGDKVLEMISEDCKVISNKAEKLRINKVNL